MLQRLLSPIVEVRRQEATTALLMFLYSFLAMTAYNIVQPITRSRFISALGADNLPYVLLVSVFIIGLLMQGYSKLGGWLPARWVVPATQGGMVGILLAFWLLFGRGDWVEVAFYLFGQIYGILLISQFWTLANLIFEPRQAKRLFGFIGGGASLGGIVGGSITVFLANVLGNRQLVLASAIVLAACAAVVLTIASKTRDVDLSGLETAGKEEGVGGSEALRMLRNSRHLQIIAAVIGLTSIAAGLIDQQLNMATEAFKGREATDAMTVVLAQVQVYTSAIGFVIQVWLTSRIQRYLGVGFALLLLPMGLGSTAVVILLNAALWAPVFARVLDKSLRYTVDKTSREILFLPLPSDVKQQAKPFVDVTVDRFGRAVVALLLLVLISDWGLGLDWQRISYASLGVMALWIAMAVVAKRAYLQAFRSSLERRDVRPAEIQISSADLETIEALVEQLAHPDDQQVLYAIDLLESLDKRHLVTPLLLHHDSPRVRARALSAMAAAREEIAERWAPAVERLIGDDDSDVRAAAVASLARIRRTDVAGLVRPLLEDPDPRMVATAAIALASTNREEDLAAAEEAWARLTRDARDTAGRARRDVAVALRQVGSRRLRHLLILLLADRDPQVVEEALRSVAVIGTNDFRFVPALVTLLRNRRLKQQARDVLVGYGEPVVEALAYFLRDPQEDIWVRRHLPATLARIPCQRSVDVLVDALAEADGFLRYKVVEALEKLRREHPELGFAREPIEQLALNEARAHSTHLSLHYNLFVRGGLPADALLARALGEKMARTLNRVYLLLGLLYPWKDVAAARWAIEHADARGRAGALEYLDNILTGTLRKRLMPVLEDAPIEERVRRANLALRTRPRDVEETMLHLINDDDPVVSAVAIDLARSRAIWSLEADIEHVLAHRDARDWYVFESASWALAERRMPAERRRQLWQEPLPATVIAGRLQGLPLFASVAVDELFRMAGAGRQVRYEPGRQLLAEGVVPDSVEFLLDGRATTIDSDGREGTIEPPATLGFEEVLVGRPATAAVRTADKVVTLALTTDELRTLLADNTDLIEGLFRTLVIGRTADPAGAVIPPGADAAPLPLGEGDLLPLERVLALRSVPTFSGVGVDEMLALTSICHEYRYQTGGAIAGAGDPPAIRVVLAGELALESSEAGHGGRLTAGPRAVVGLYQTLAGAPLGWSLHAVRSSRVLRIERVDLFDLLSNRPGLLQELFNALFQTGRAGAPAASPR